MEERNTSGDLLSKDLSNSTWETNSISLNGSYYNYDTPCNVKNQAMILLSLIISAVGMVLNSIVLWFLGFRIHRNAFSVYILNLAVADLLFLCFQFVFCLLAIIYFFYSIYVNVPLFFYVVPNFAYLSGLSILSAISTERCLSVLWPIWYHCRRPRHTSAVICIFLWALSLMLGLLKGKACGLLSDNFDLDFSWCYRFYVINTVWSIVLFVVLCGFSLILFVRIFYGSHRIPMTRLYVIIALTVLLFLIFGLPFGIYWLLYEVLQDLYYIKNCDFYIDILFLSCINSCANPIIYFLVGSIRHRRFQQKSLKLLLQRAMQDTPEEEEGGERGTSGNPEEVETV